MRSTLRHIVGTYGLPKTYAFVSACGAVVAGLFTLIQGRVSIILIGVVGLTVLVFGVLLVHERRKWYREQQEKVYTFDNRTER